MNSKVVKKYLAVSAITGVLIVMGEYKEVTAANVRMEIPREEYLIPEQRTYPELVFPQTETYIYIRSDGKEESPWIGKLYRGGAAKVIGGTDRWLQIESGTVTGYVKAEELILEETAVREQQLNARTAIVTADILNVRQGQGIDTPVLTQVTETQVLTVSGDSVNGWVPILAGNTAGFVCETYVEIQTQYSYAESKGEEETRIAQEAIEAERAAEEARIAKEQQAAAVSASAAGQAVVNYACQFIGNPYIWGGTDLVNGADCSGFIQSVYAHFGINLPRTTYDIEQIGMSVDYTSAMPGDIVCYDGHAGIYMGNNQIVNAIDDAHGINISSATFGYIRSVRRVL